MKEIKEKVEIPILEQIQTKKIKISKSQRITEWNNLKILDNKVYHRKFFILLIVSNLLAFTNPSKFVFEISSIVFLIIPKLKTLNCLNE